jgi:hypothetical protein
VGSLKLTLAGYMSSGRQPIATVRNLYYHTNSLAVGSGQAGTRALQMGAHGGLGLVRVVGPQGAEYGTVRSPSSYRP